MPEDNDGWLVVEHSLELDYCPRGEVSSQVWRVHLGVSQRWTVTGKLGEPQLWWKSSFQILFKGKRSAIRHRADDSSLLTAANTHH